MATSRTIPLALAAITLGLAGVPAAQAQGYRPAQVAVGVHVDPEFGNVAVDVTVGSAYPSQPAYPPVVREQVDEYHSERHTTREYGR
ncbi:hypothetical protein [Methylobacterium sp. SI9]|uniref:hypothetical protein n=1 Tax=Methylobacterium guangdongense TaxID=3138811 RepID=UPI00313E2257